MDVAGPGALTAEDATRLEKCLAGGGVAIFPADTVYGLACDPLRREAVDRLYELKGRPPERPAAVMFFAVDQALETLPELGPRERAALRALLPGPLTLLLPNREHRYPLAGGPRTGVSQDELGALGLRVPRLPERLGALRTVPGPIMQSSANLSGGREARRLSDISPTLLGGADLVLDGGELPGMASTVLDLRGYEPGGRWHIVREGPFGQAELERILGSC